MMSSYADDRLLWLLVVGSLLSACYAVPKALEHIRTLTEVNSPPVDTPKPPPKPKYDENTLDISILHTLATGPSHDIRAVAVKLIATRSLNDEGTTKLLARDLSSDDPATRDRAIDALHFYFTSAALEEIENATGFFEYPPMIDALASLLDHYPAEIWHRKLGSPLPASPVRPEWRPQGEKKLLVIIHIMQAHNFEHFGFQGGGAVRDGLVTRWLSKYPFPCSIYPYGNYHREDITSLFVDKTKYWGSDYEEMADIFRDLLHDPDAVELLQECGLDYRGRQTFSSEHPTDADDWRNHPQGPSSFEEWTLSAPRRRSDDVEDASIPPDYYNLPELHEIAGPHRRRTDRTQQQELLRRRHREAVVIAEQAMPLAQGSIGREDESRRWDDETRF